MSPLLWIGSLARADWTEHLVESRFLSTPDFPFAGIDVRVDVEGLGPLWLQIDTGVSEAVRLYGRSLSAPPQERFVAAGAIGELRFSGEVGFVLPNLGGPGGAGGVVGVAAFDGSWLVLDLAEERVAVLTAPDEALNAATCWVNTEEQYGVHWVYVEGFGGLLFDTGSAPHGVWTNPKGFAWLTGRKPDPSLRIGAGNAWGRTITVLGAPAQRAVRVGALDLGKPLVTHVPERQDLRRAGVLGLQAFAGRVVVLDLIRERLGRVGPCAP